MEKALLVTIKFKTDKDNWSMEDSAIELEELVMACGVEILDNVSCICDKPTPNFLIGRGKAEEISLQCQEMAADVVIFSHDLSGTHQRNLEELIGRKTIDRTQLILDVFARHARSPEGKTQVELAQLQYLFPRLVGKGIMLSRLGGGIGTSGPGEQKLEVDRRRIRKRIDRLKSDLKQISLHRQLMRKKRAIQQIPSVSLVGYTNAGKSTLLNTLAGSSQAVADSLFTTLDPLSKRFKLPNGEHVVLSDTVGFLHDLPHHLIEAFKATLEELIDADLLIHVLDIAHPKFQEHKEAVFKVLKELGIENKPMVTVLNKIDLLEQAPDISTIPESFTNPVFISASQEKNIQELLLLLEKNLPFKLVNLKLSLPADRMDLVDFLYRQGKIKEIKYTQGGIKIVVGLPESLIHNILQYREKE